MTLSQEAIENKAPIPVLINCFDFINVAGKSASDTNVICYCFRRAGNPDDLLVFLIKRALHFIYYNSVVFISCKNTFY